MGVGVRSSAVKGATALRMHACMWRVGFLCAFFALILSACSFSEAPPPPPPVTPLDTQTPTAMDTFRALAPSEGLKYTTLFPDRSPDTDPRVARLEDAVQILRNDFDTVVPTLVRLAAIEKDMKTLVLQLQSLSDLPPETAAPQPAPAVLPPSAYVSDAQGVPLASGNQTAAPQVVPPAPVAPIPQPAQTPPQQIQQQQVPPAPQTAAGSAIPGEGAAEGTETAGREKAGPTPPSLVTPEAASQGLPPEGAASPNSQAPVPLKLDRPIDWSRGAQMGAPPAPVPGPAAKAVRLADHKDKTRIVIDLSDKAACKATIGGPKGKTLIVNCPGLDWSAIKTFDAETGEMVAGWYVQAGDLVVDLLKLAEIKTSEVLPPGGAPTYRMVIDIAGKKSKP